MVAAIISCFPLCYPQQPASCLPACLLAIKEQCCGWFAEDCSPLHLGSVQLPTYLLSVLLRSVTAACVAAWMKSKWKQCRVMMIFGLGGGLG